MKMDKFALIIVLGISVGIGLLYRVRRKAESANQRQLNYWGNETLASELSRKLKLSRSQLLEVLQGARNPDITTQIDRAIDRINLCFVRPTAHGSIEVNLNVAYSDGNSFSAQTSSAWEELPEAVRAKFLRFGQKTVEHEWLFPWVSA